MAVPWIHIWNKNDFPLNIFSISFDLIPVIILWKTAVGTAPGDSAVWVSLCLVVLHLCVWHIYVWNIEYIFNIQNINERSFLNVQFLQEFMDFLLNIPRTKLYHSTTYSSNTILCMAVIEFYNLILWTILFVLYDHNVFIWPQFCGHINIWLLHFNFVDNTLKWLLQYNFVDTTLNMISPI